MHGFFGTYGKRATWDLSSYEDKSLVKRTYDKGELSLTQFTLPKFLNDKYFEENDGCFLAVEGVLFESDKPDKAIEKYHKGDTTFWNSWRGSFAGVLYDSQTNTLQIFNDHIGSKMLFYAQTKDGFAFASDLLLLAKTIGADEVDLSFIKAILDSGYTSEARTFVKGIKRLTAGQYLRLCGSKLQIADYHRFDNTPWKYDEAKMLNETDKLFRQAVQRVVRKNEQECLQQFYPLSGGLDSRMTQWIARQIATQPIVNYTYSQSGHYDHLLPQKISKTLGNKWQFMPLDGGSYLTQIDDIAHATEWLINYNGPSEIYAFASQQDWKDKGVVLTGVNGDNILAVITDSRREIDLLYSLSFAGNGLGSPLVLQHYTESYSPFCDVDLLNYVLHIPNSKRRNYYFYDKWILTFYPDAAQWHHKHEFIGQRKKMVTIAGRNMWLQDVPKRLLLTTLKRLHIYDGYRIDEDSMNPYDRWVKENPQILAQMEAYYAAHKPLINNKDLVSVCDAKMKMGTIMEKCKVLTILSAFKAFVGNE